MEAKLQFSDLMHLGEPVRSPAILGSFTFGERGLTQTNIGNSGCLNRIQHNSSSSSVTVEMKCSYLLTYLSLIHI